MKKLVYVIMAALFIWITAPLGAEVTVVSVTGSVNVKTDKQWSPLQKGMRLSEGTKISTGVKSTAEINMDGHVVTIKPMSMVMVQENKLDGGVSTNRIGLRRGTVRAAINKESRVKTVFRISTPVATSSVRGTIEEISQGPQFGMGGNADAGHLEMENRKGDKKDISGNLTYNQSGDDPNSGDVMGDTSGDSSASVGDNSLSGEEGDSNNFNSSDVIDSSSDSGDIIDNNVKGSGKVQANGIYQKK